MHSVNCCEDKTNKSNTITSYMEQLCMREGCRRTSYSVLVDMTEFLSRQSSEDSSESHSSYEGESIDMLADRVWRAWKFSSSSLVNHRIKSVLKATLISIRHPPPHFVSVSVKYLSFMPIVWARISVASRVVRFTLVARPTTAFIASCSPQSIEKQIVIHQKSRPSATHCLCVCVFPLSIISNIHQSNDTLEEKKGVKTIYGYVALEHRPRFY